MLKIPKKITSEDFFKLLLILFWGNNFIVSYARAVLMRLPVISVVSDAVFPGLSLLCFLGALPFMFRNFTYKDLIFLLACAVAYCLNLLIYRPTQAYLLEKVYTFWALVFPMYFVGLRIDKREYVRLMYGISLLNIWLFFVYSSLFGVEMSSDQSVYSGAMGRAYMLLPHVLIILLYAMREHKIGTIATGVVASLYLFSCGTRGAVVALFAFLILFVILRVPGKKRPLLYLIIVILVVLVMHFYEEILLTMRMVSQRIGMSVRVFERLMNGSFFISDSRNALSSGVWAALKEKPFTGYGIAGDWGIIGVYSHNFVLEMLVSYGLILGSILCGAVFWIFYRGYTKAKIGELQDLILLFLCAAFLKLFLSNSYLLEENFFLLLGICVTQIRTNKKLPTGEMRRLA